MKVPIKDSRARQHFGVLTQKEVQAAICRMAAQGYSDYMIATATRIAVEQVRSIIAEGRHG